MQNGKTRFRYGGLFPFQRQKKAGIPQGGIPAFLQTLGY